MERANDEQVALHGGKAWHLMTRNSLDYGDIIGADVNNTFYPPSPSVTGAINVRLGMLNHLPDPDCTSLKTQLSSFHGIDSRYIAIGNGSSDLLQTIITGFVGERDQVVILHPTYAEYERCATSVGAEVVRVSLSEDSAFQASCEDILARVGKYTKLVVLCNPNNPTGHVINRNALLKILSLLDSTTFLLVDEAYIEFSPDDTLGPDIYAHPNLIVVRTFSKAYALAGLRLGYALFGERAASHFSKLIRPPWPVNVLALAAAEVALKDQAYVRWMIDLTKEFKAELVRDLMRSVPGLQIISGEANFFLVNVEATGQDATSICQGLERQGILVRDCRSFGHPLQGRFIRLATQSKDNNKRIINALRTLVKG